MHSFNEVDENIESYYHSDELLNKTIVEIQKYIVLKSFLLMVLNQRGLSNFLINNFKF